MNEPRFNPLKGFIPDPASGGRVKSERKTKSSRINALKSGIQAKNPDTIKALAITPMEKLAGITLPDKVRALKSSYAFFGTTNREEFQIGIQTMIADSMISILRKEKEGKDTTRDRVALTSTVMELYDRMFGKVVNNNNLNVNIETFSLDYSLYRKAVLLVLQNAEKDYLGLISKEYERLKGGQ